MYILILVTTLLMLLAIIGTTRFELFLNASGIRTAYEKYMQEEERSYYNSREKALYETTPRSQSKSSPNESEDKNKVKAPRPSPKLNIRPLIFPEESFPEEYRNFVKQTLIRLVENTYGNQKFFGDITPAEFVEVFTKEAQEEICGAAVEQVSDLAAVKFENSEMRKIFFQMIRGPGKGQGKNSLPSLLDFLTLHKQPVPLRIFLAKRTVLMAIYANSAVVNQVMEYRQRPFESFVVTPEALAATAEADETDETPTLAGEDKKTLDAASEQFKIQSFNSQRYPDIPEKYLDFTVSGSIPPK